MRYLDFKDNTISRRVMAVVRSKIATAQKIYDDRCKVLEDEHEEARKKLATELETNKENEAQKLVEEICGKFI